MEFTAAAVLTWTLMFSSTKLSSGRHSFCFPAAEAEKQIRRRWNPRILPSERFTSGPSPFIPRFIPSVTLRRWPITPDINTFKSFRSTFLIHVLKREKEAVSSSWVYLFHSVHERWLQLRWVCFTFSLSIRKIKPPLASSHTKLTSDRPQLYVSLCSHYESKGFSLM